MPLKIVILLFLTPASAQKEIKNWVFADAFGYEYFIENNTLHKKNEIEKYEYKNINLGTISYIDAKNSFQILVVYNDFHTVIVLDNFLNEIRKIDFLNDFQGFMLEYVATAAGNKLWIKEKNTNSFFILDLKSNQFIALNRPMDHKIKSIHNDFNFLYFITNENELHRINIYGNIENLATLNPTISEFKVGIDKLVFVLENQIFVYNWKENKEKLIFTSDNKIENCSINLNKLFIFANDKITEIDIK